MNDKQIACFLEVAKCLSFSKAAQNLFLTQPTVTHQIAALEAEVGFSLFDRNYRSVALTPAGIRFFERMTKIDEQVRSAIAEGQAITRYYRNALTLSHYSPEGDNRFYQAVQTFSAANEDVEIDVRLPAAASLPDHLLQRKLDAVILPAQALPQSQEICCLRLFSNPEYCIMSRRHPLASRAAIALDDLRGVPCMLHRCAQGETIPWHEQQLLRQKAPELIPGEHTMRELITNIRAHPCVMISLYPLLFISDDLVRVPFRDGPQVETVLAWRRDNEKNSLKKLISFLSAFYADAD